MTAEVVNFNGPTLLDLPAERVLQAAIKADLADAVVIGFAADGDFYFSSTKADGGTVLWLMELAKKKLLEVEI